MGSNLRRLTGISRQFMLVILTLSTGMRQLTTAVRAEYEEPPTFSATELLSPELVKGSNHIDAEQVRNFLITREFGKLDQTRGVGWQGSILRKSGA